jgi:hypothetical protein
MVIVVIIGESGGFGGGSWTGRLFVGVLKKNSAAKKLCRLTSCLKRFKRPFIILFKRF